MKLPAGYLLSKACANAKERENAPALAAAYVRQRDDRLVIFATNGVLAVSVLLPEGSLDENDRPGAIPVEAVYAAEKNRTDEYTPELTLGDTDVIAKLSAEETLIVHRNPDLGADVEGAILSVEKVKEQASILVDVEQLSRLAKALGTTKVKVSVRGATGSLLVSRTGEGVATARGILAQLRAE